MSPAISGASRRRLSSLAMGLGLLTVVCAPSAPGRVSEPVVVFQNGSGPYACYRIPALVVSKDGALLAFVEGRRTCHDHSHNDLVLKTSTDGGRTWGPAQVLVANDNVMVDPSPVVLADGDIIVLIQEFPEGRHARPGERFQLLSPGFGEGSQRVWMLRSQDGGESWSLPEDLTRVARGEEGDVLTAGSPAPSIQLQRGEHQGRILAPQYYTTWSGDQRSNYLGVLYSDDAGASWARGGFVTAPGSESSTFLTECNEVQVVEMADGTVVLNARGNEGGRYASFSTDGGLSWERTQHVLEATANNDAIIALPGPRESTTLVQAMNADRTSRRHGVLLTSRDGLAWTKVMDLTEPSAGFAYSAFAETRDGNIGLLYEAADSGGRSIQFMEIDRSALGPGEAN